MKRKQFLAWVLAGTLALGMNPCAIGAEEGFEGIELAEETSAMEPVYEDQGSADPGYEEPVYDEGAIVDIPQENTGGFGDSVDVEGGETDETVENTETTESTENATAAIIYPDPGNPLLTAPEDEVFPIQVISGGTTDTSCATIADLAAKLTAMTGSVQVVLSTDLEMTQSISVSSGLDLTITAGADVRLTRGLSFNEDFFILEGGTLRVVGGTSESGNDTSITFVGRTGTDVTGSFIHLFDGEAEIGKGAALTGNSTSAKGAAIYAEGGSVILDGCNTSENVSTEENSGAIYIGENAEVCVGSPDGNPTATRISDELVLEKGPIQIYGDISGTDISVYFLNIENGMEVLKPFEGSGTLIPEDFSSLFSFNLDIDKLILNEENGCLYYEDAPVPVTAEILFSDMNWKYWDVINGTLTFMGSEPGDKAYVTVLKQTSTVTGDVPATNYEMVELTEANQAVTSSVKFTDFGLGDEPVQLAAYLEKADGTVACYASYEMDQTERSPRIGYVSPHNGKAERIDKESVMIYLNTKLFTSQNVGEIRYLVYDEEPTKTDWKEAASLGVFGTGEHAIQIDGLKAEKQFIYVQILDSNNKRKSRVLKLIANAFSPVPTEKPTGTPTVTPTVTVTETPSPTPINRENKNPKITECTAKFNNSFTQFEAGKGQPFTVYEAGSDNTSPIQGDTRWRYIGWSTKADGSSIQGTSKSIQSSSTVDASKYIFYAVFRKQVYGANGWEDTNEVGTVQITKGSGGNNNNSGGTTTDDDDYSSGSSTGSYYGIDSDGDGEVDYYATRQELDEDGNSVTAKGANTADNSPIGMMLLLLGVSAAAILILARRRTNA